MADGSDTLFLEGNLVEVSEVSDCFRVRNSKLLFFLSERKRTLLINSPASAQALIATQRGTTLRHLRHQQKNSFLV